MKILNIIVIYLAVLTLVGCNESNENNPEKVAETFITEHFTVDSTEVENFNDFLDLLTMDSQELTKAIEANDGVIKPLMTEKAYNILVMNRENLMFAMYCSLNDYTIEIKNINFDEISNEENKVDYNFDVEIKFVSNVDKSKDITDIAKGYLVLIKENEEWKISGYKSFEFPKTIVP